MFDFVAGFRSSLRATRPRAVRGARTYLFTRGHIMGMNWILSTAKGRTLAMHEGGTGGASSFIAFDRAAQRGVIPLSDTSLIVIGDVSVFGLHLLDPAIIAGPPRVAAVAEAPLLDALAGSYRLQNGMHVELRRKGSTLTVQADGQPEFEMGYDSAGDFHPLLFDAVPRPRRRDDGGYAVTWFQGGGAFAARRIDPAASAAGR